MIEINNRTRSNVSEAFLRKVARRVLVGEKVRGKGISIALLTPRRAAELNKKYRRKNTVANVLSFEGEGKELGEILICPQQVKREAKEYGMILEKALAWMLIHGLLHLLHYTHDTASNTERMEQKERRYLARIKSFLQKDP